MKRLLSTITLLLAVSLLFSVRAQTLEEQLRTADALKKQYGETNSRYLDALSKAVPIAFNEGSVEMAIDLRLHHSEIIKRIFGEKSLEYAEDIWRLGNISAQKESSCSIGPYEKVASLLKSINQERTVLFCDTQWKLYFAYREKNDWPSAINAMNQFTEKAPSCVDIEWNGISIQHINIAHGYLMLCAAYGGIVKDNELALNAIKKCVAILEEKDLLNDYVYTSRAYSLLSGCYHNAHDDINALKWRLRSAEMTARLKGVNSDDYINELILLRGCYAFLEDSENEVATQERVVSLIQERNKEKGIDVFEDDQYLKELDYLRSAYFKAGRSEGELATLSALMSIYRKKGRTVSEKYLEYLYELDLLYHVSGNYSAEYQLFKEYDEIAEALDKIETEEYYHVLSNKVFALTILYKDEEYKKVQSQWKELTEKLYGSQSIQRLRVEVESISHLLTLEKFHDARIHLDYCYERLNSGEITFANERDSLAILGDLYLAEGQILASSAPPRAENKYLKAMDIYSRLGLPLFEPLNNLGVLYKFCFRDSRKALVYFKRAKEEIIRCGESNTISYISAICNIAVCHQELGMSSEAIAVLDEAEDMVKQHFGLLHPLYGTIAQNKSTFYAKLSDYDRAIEYALDAASCMKHNFGEGSDKYTICLLNLSVFYGVKGSINESKELLLRAIPILEKSNSPYAIASYCCLLSHYSHDSNWKDYYDLVNKCSSLIEDSHLQDTDIEAMFLASVGDGLKDKDISEAQMYLSKAIQVYENVGATSSTEYFTTLLAYYRTLVQNTKNNRIIYELTDAYKNLYLANVIFFNAAEREQFVSSSTYSTIKDIIFTARSDKSQDALLYDYLLFSKGLLLETSINYAKTIYNSNNSELIGQFSRLVELKRVLSGEKGKNKDVSIVELQKEASSLERRITSFLKETGGYADGLKCTFGEVSKALKSTEAAIEFVSYHDYSEDVDYYAALVVKKDWETPEFVRICKKSEMEKLLSLSPAVLYGESVASEEAYSIIWKPIMSIVSDIETIYYSPADYLNRLAIEHLYNGKKRFNELFRVYRVTSTRQICSLNPQVKFSSAVLYGGLNYDEDDMTMVAESINIRGEKSAHNLTLRGWNSTMTRKGWEYLPGTLEEVNRISAIITDKRIRCDVYTSGKGNEESFKALSGGNFSILHLATHGFYLTESQAEKNLFYTLNPWTSTSISTEVSPLKRSGLLMAGGNKAWRGEPVPDGVEDGVLTAEEIASLDLRSCDVVVLSACETGLGEITDEGVYGLQRAFKNAGVKSIIMSLWEVDDEATSFMMLSFYRNLLKEMNKRDAFESAQKEVKKKYIDPRYWAAFIMLD